jgi:O-methyltransferase involved in polyketide biosynthesis
MAEGLFMYLSHGQIEALLDDLQAHFPGAELLFDATVPWYCKIKQETVRHTDAAFVSGIRHAGQFALKHDLTLLYEDNIWHLQRARWGWLGRCALYVAPLRDIHRFLHFRFKARA